MEEDKQLLAEIEDLIRTAPEFTMSKYKWLDNMNWPGRAAAAIRAWDPIAHVTAGTCLSQLSMSTPDIALGGFNRLRMLLDEAKDDLQRRVGIPMSIVVDKGMRFDYFDQIRSILESAHREVLVVDPYLDNDFVSTYLTQISNDIPVRLLTSNSKRASLIPAVKLLTDQTGIKVETRFNNDLHDRYLFVDRRECYQSGASFKDGAVNAMTTVTQIRDVFNDVFRAYERIWDASDKEI